MITPPRATKAPNIERKAIMDWTAGTVTDFNARRLVDNSLLKTTNMVLEQNGVVRPRPAFVEYGPQPIGKVLGELFECKVLDGTRAVFYLLAMMVVDGVANVYYAKGEDNQWQKIDGKDYDNSAPAHFLQVGGVILVLNGVDKMTYINPEEWVVTLFQELTNLAETPATETTGLTGEDFYIYYAVTANSTVGETAGSPVATQAISTQRAKWNPETQSVKLTWNPVAGATSYNVYMGTTSDGDGEPTLYLIASGLDAATQTFTDNGVRSQDLTRTLPVYNSTAGPCVKRGAVVNGRVWLVGDADNPYYVRFGGDYGHELDFSPSNGGGFVPVASGTREIPVAVMPFRKGQGDNTVVVLTQGSNGGGKRYHITPNTYSYGSMGFVAWEAIEDSGTDGTDSPDGVVIYNNSLYYPSRDGFKTTGTQPQLQNVLSTTRISNTIRDQVALFNTSAMDKAVGLAYEGKIYWSLPVGADHNNRVFVFDIERKGSWIVAWYIDVEWMTLYNDNSGKTHFLVLSNGQIYDMSRIFMTKDGGEPFPTELASGQIEWSKDGREWARLIQVVFTLLNPRGKINIEVAAKTEEGEQKWATTIYADSARLAIGWGEVGRRWSTPIGWSVIRRMLTDDSAKDESLDIMLEVDEDVQWFSYRISSSESGVDYSLSSVVAEFVSIGLKDLS